MPLYEYKCLKCGRLTEKIESVSGPHLKKCPHCGGRVESVLSAPAIQFKGSGWYVTDYAGKSTDGGSKEVTGEGNEASAGNSKDATGKGAGKETTEKAASKDKDTSSKDKKPLKKK